MTQNVKKERERQIFDMTYGERTGLVVTISERPDFLVRLKNDLPQFGVEIAEFYHSESQARLARIPGYTHDLLTQKKFRHKDDKRVLRVDKVSILTEDNQVKAADIPAIITNSPSVAECASKVAEIIIAKDAKLDVTFGQLPHVNLVICDRTNPLSLCEPSVFYRLYCIPHLREAVLSCRFREIYFVTRFKSGWTFIPLKALVTLAEFYFFHKVVRTPQFRQRVDSIKGLIQLFAAYLRHVAIGPVFFRSDEHGHETIYGDAGFMVTEKMAIHIRQYLDWQFPNDSQSASQDFEALLGQPFLQSLAAFKEENTFVTDFAIPVKSLER